MVPGGHSHYVIAVHGRRTRTADDGTQVTLTHGDTLCGQVDRQFLHTSEPPNCSACNRTFDRRMKQKEHHKGNEL